MAVAIIVPKMSATMEKALVLRWLKETGDKVDVGDPLIELETDKATLEVEATAAGFLSRKLVAENDTVFVGATLSHIVDQAGDAPPSSPSQPPDAAPEVAEEIGSGPTVSSAKSPSMNAPGAQEPAVMASPLAKKLARQHGIELAGVKGSGPGGRVLKEDVRALASGASHADCKSPPDTVRARVAEQVSLSRREIPAFWLERWVSLDSTIQSMDNLNQSGSSMGSPKVTLTDFFLAAISGALPSHPRFMEVWDKTGERAVRLEEQNIGLVVGLPDGMLIPVLKGLEDVAVKEFSGRRTEAVAAARAGRLSTALTGPCAIMLSNMARSDIDRFEGIINPGSSSILAVGRLHERVVPRHGEIRVEQGCTFTLSVDHRVIDGLAGAAFLGAVAKHLEPN